MNKVIKMVLAVLLLGCLASMPYGYYQLVRFAAMVGFGILAYLSHEKKKSGEALIFFILCLLFQPFVKIVLGRELWNIVDLVVALGLVGSLFLRKESKQDV